MTHERTKLVLHIGLRKTGSSALQECLANASDTLLKHAVVYPERLTRFPAHQELAWSLHETLPKYAIMNLSRTEVFDHYEREIEKNSENGITTILSSEDLSLHTFNYSGLQYIWNRFGKFDPVIVVVVRDPIDYHISNYKHAILAGREIRSFGEFVFRPNSLIYADQSTVPGIWRNLFGKESVLTLNYEDISSSGKGILSWFLSEVFGIEGKEIFSEHKSNTSLSNEMTKLALELNRSDLPDEEIKKIKRTLHGANGSRDRVSFLSSFIEKPQRDVLLQIYGMIDE